MKISTATLTFLLTALGQEQRALGTIIARHRNGVDVGADPQRARAAEARLEKVNAAIRELSTKGGTK